MEQRRSRAPTHPIPAPWRALAAALLSPGVPRHRDPPARPKHPERPLLAVLWQPRGVATDLLPVRRVNFEYPDDFDPLWAPHLPEFAALANGVSLGMPYAEPLFIRAVRMAMPDLDEDLAARTETYIKQEVGHYTQHKRLNDLVAAHHPGVLRLQRWMDACAKWVSRRSKRFNIAYAAGGETISYGVARWTEQNLRKLMDRSEPVAATLFLWHLAEEIEHKSSTYDVFEATDGKKRWYALAMAMGFVSISVFALVGAIIQLWGNKRLRYPITWFRLLRISGSLAFTLLPVMVVSTLPGHHPRQFADPVFLRQWIHEYDEATGTMPLYRSPMRAAA